MSPIKLWNSAFVAVWHLETCSPAGRVFAHLQEHCELHRIYTEDLVQGFPGYGIFFQEAISLNAGRESVKPETVLAKSSMTPFFSAACTKNLASKDLQLYATKMQGILDFSHSMKFCRVTSIAMASVIGFPSWNSILLWKVSLFTSDASGDITW